MPSYLYRMYLSKKCLLSLGLFAVTSVPAFAQVDKEEKEEKKAASKQKVEYNVFRRQILTLPEFGDERRKVAELQKGMKQQVKLVAYVDSTNDAEDAKTLAGYIRENVGDNTTDVYEVTYDRALKKITAVRPTGDKLELDKDEKPVKKSAAASKKQKDEDADEEEPAAKKKPQPRRTTEDDDDE